MVPHSNILGASRNGSHKAQDPVKRLKKKQTIHFDCLRLVPPSPARCPSVRIPATRLSPSAPWPTSRLWPSVLPSPPSSRYTVLRCFNSARQPSDFVSFLLFLSRLESAEGELPDGIQRGRRQRVHGLFLQVSRFGQGWKMPRSGWKGKFHNGRRTINKKKRQKKTMTLILIQPGATANKCKYLAKIASCPVWAKIAKCPEVAAKCKVDFSKCPGLAGKNGATASQCPFLKNAAKCGVLMQLGKCKPLMSMVTSFLSSF